MADNPHTPLLPSDISVKSSLSSSFSRSSALLEPPPPLPSVAADPGSSPRPRRCRTRASPILPPIRPDLFPRGLHPHCRLLTDIRNVLRECMSSIPFNAFSPLTPLERTQLNSLNTAVESIRDFFSDCQDDPHEWTLCARCMEECHILVAKEDWEAVLMSCNGDVQAAKETVVNQCIRDFNQEVAAWADNQRSTARDTVINTPSQTSPSIGISSYGAHVLSPTSNLTSRMTSSVKP